MSTERLNIYQRVLACMKDVPYIQKQQRKTGLQYTFVSRDSVVSKLRAPMIEHGIIYKPHMISWSIDGNKTSMEVLHTYSSADDPNDKIEFANLGYGIDSQDKGPGKAMTYCEKLAHLKLFQIEAGDEDECENYDEEHVPEKQAATKKATAATAKRAETKTPSIDSLKARYAETATKYGISSKDFGKLFSDSVDETKRQDATALNAFLNDIDTRYSAWMEVLEAIKKWSVSGDMFDASVAKIVGEDSTVTEKNWFTHTAKTLNALANQVHADNDLPFDGEGKAIPK